MNKPFSPSPAQCRKHLTFAQAERRASEIHRLRATGITQQAIADQLNLSRALVAAYLSPTNKASIRARAVAPCSAFDREQWEDSPECRRCNVPMALNDLTEWPEDDRALLCWGCLSRSLTEALDKLDAVLLPND